MSLRGVLWQNFLESIAQVLSRILTDEETEVIVNGVKSLESRLQAIKSLKDDQLLKNVNRLCKHEGGCLSHGTRGWIKSFLAGLVLKYAMDGIPMIVSGRLFNGNNEMLTLLGGKDTLKFALFLAMFIGGYKYLLCFLRHQRGVDDGLNTFVAGSISALALLFDQQQRRIAISMYLMTRTLQFTCSALVNAGYVPKLPHADVLVMALSSAAILNAYIFAPDTLPKQYMSFLVIHGGMLTLYREKARTALAMMGKFGRGDYSSLVLPTQPLLSPVLSDSLLSSAYIPELDMPASVNFPNCSIQHPFSSCAPTFFNFFPGSFSRSLSLYVPLNLFMASIFQHHQMLQDPIAFLKSVGKSIFRSSLFLSVYCSAAYSLPCWFRKVLGFEWLPSYFISGFLSGFSVLLEGKGRRMELAMYCLPRAIESVWHRLEHLGLVKNIKYGEAVYFSLSMGILMYIYEFKPEAINRRYRDILVRFLGVN